MSKRRKKQPDETEELTPRTRFMIRDGDRFKWTRRGTEVGCLYYVGDLSVYSEEHGTNNSVEILQIVAGPVFFDEAFEMCKMQRLPSKAVAAVEQVAIPDLSANAPTGRLKGKT